MLSLSMAEALLNASNFSSVSSTIVFDCGCCGWVALITMADYLLKEPFSSSSSSTLHKNHVQMTYRTVLARLPLIFSSSSASSSSSSSSSQLPVYHKQWVCDDAVNGVLDDKNDGEIDGGGSMLRRALLRIRDAFRYVS